MKSSDLIKYIESPDLLTSESIPEIKKILSDYPYFQTAHKLLLKNLKLINPDQFQNQLNASAIHISDRNRLFHYLQTEVVKTLVEDNEKARELVTKPDELKEEITIKPDPEIKIAETEKEKKPKLLKNQNIRRKIKDGIDGMGDNISHTISNQLEFVESNNKQELEYPNEIYFIEEERIGKSKHAANKPVDENTGIQSKKDLLFIEDETQNIKDIELNQNDSSITGDSEDQFVLIDIDENTEEKKKEPEKSNQSQHFDISDYADENEILTNSDENDLITKFITKNPRIKPKELDEYEQIDISENSMQEDESLLTETLAKVYIAQGYFEKAIHTYEKLCLKYPEKNTYFASQVVMIKEQINKQKNS
ncbi:MAG: hypothetical protein A2X13_05815 [Bacteroidetes bacterium GWC2_33_15]|nr:MAG: hypothetical protein A2X10_00500 [Bacteroidetes bacterium GWA2_33_15]OFX52006.1 MAG: hypothetical protein A2X13_05815 [Bacteroidetes bacterium GWC2_33_15]OFX63836.1 MAG: hypothetical protein A2X15_00740 [Bacteroidetes bacterium GWB2_32_14]OFX67409.1 MAG: hypothetical protein A2X14_12545 [Bacteroidetes bacterium GWD2_33_33]HAN17826.1 hypothetical protein [Bacteroidales bacterium]